MVDVHEAIAPRVLSAAKLDLLGGTGRWTSFVPDFLASVDAWVVRIDRVIVGHAVRILILEGQPRKRLHAPSGLLNQLSPVLTSEHVGISEPEKRSGEMPLAAFAAVWKIGDLVNPVRADNRLVAQGKLDFLHVVEQGVVHRVSPEHDAFGASRRRDSLRVSKECNLTLVLGFDPLKHRLAVHVLSERA